MSQRGVSFSAPGLSGLDVGMAILRTLREDLGANVIDARDDATGALVVEVNVPVERAAARYRFLLRSRVAHTAAIAARLRARQVALSERHEELCERHRLLIETASLSRQRVRSERQRLEVELHRARRDVRLAETAG